ncbi:MAG: BrxA/BrxB family bacilliredoxin [Gemmatimonadales bacterium]
MYDPTLVQPMRDETVAMGLEELTTVAAVDAVLANHSGTALVMVNSVCGCAAGTARPGLKLAMSHDVTPDKAYSVFAGVDTEATQRARSYFGEEFQPSSPSMALLRDGEVVAMLHRHMIEGRSPEEIAADLTAAFDKHCGTTV